MSIAAHYRQGPRYLIVAARGRWTEHGAKRLLDAIREEAVRRAQTRLFLDLRELSPPDSELTRYFTGEHLARVLRPPFKVAAWGRSAQINRFAESAAVNRGAALAVFADEKVALQWLLEGAFDASGAGA